MIINTNTSEGRRLVDAIQSGEVKYNRSGFGYEFTMSNSMRSMRQSEVESTLKTRDFIRSLRGD